MDSLYDTKKWSFYTLICVKEMLSSCTYPRPKKKKRKKIIALLVLEINIEDCILWDLFPLSTLRQINVIKWNMASSGFFGE